MQRSQRISDFRKAIPALQVLDLDDSQWAERRMTRSDAERECTPLAIAIPKNAEQVSDVVRWAVKNDIDFTVRSGGNDFYGRCVVDGGLMIDMRDINFIDVAADKKTATIGGGVITKDLILALEAEGLMAPVANTWIVGYVGWATLGGYGPLMNFLGMGCDGITGAQVVDATGQIAEASEEMLEGIRGMGGNLGIVTSLTIKLYQSNTLLSGSLLFDATSDNIKSIVNAQANLYIPSELTLHTFCMKIPQPMVVVMFTWCGQNHESGKKYMQDILASMPPVAGNTVQEKSMVEHQEQIPLARLPYGSQRSLYLREISPRLVDIIQDVVKTMPAESNLGWSMTTMADHPGMPPNTFGVDSHILFSFADTASEEKLLQAAQQWTDELYERLRSSGEAAVMPGSYPPLTRPTDRSPEQLYGKKWERVKELKQKFDADNVFKWAAPKIVE